MRMFSPDEPLLSLPELMRKFRDIAISLNAETNDLNRPLAGGGTVLNLAAFVATVEEIVLLLECGAHINAVGDMGYTPLHSAAAWGQSDAVQVLIAAQADTSVQNNNGDTPADVAIKNGHHKIANLILNVEQHPLQGNSTPQSEAPAQKAALRELVRKYSHSPAFLGWGMVDPNQPGAMGDTLLHLIAHVGTVAEALLLLECGAHVNTVGDMGYTPLHSAATWGQRQIVINLLEFGAAPLLRNEFGQTPREAAERRKHWEIADLLRAAEQDHTIS